MFLVVPLCLTKTDIFDSLLSQIDPSLYSQNHEMWDRDAVLSEANSHLEEPELKSVVTKREVHIL